MKDIAFLLVAGTLFAWRFSRTRPEPDWAVFNLWNLLGAVPYRDHQECKPPGVFIWYWLLGRIVGRDIARVKFAHHLIINLGALVAYREWGISAGLAYLMLMNCGHLFCFMGSVEHPMALFLTIFLASHNPWVKVAAFSIACLFNLKIWPMGILLIPFWKETLVLLSPYLLGFGLFWKLKPDIAQPMVKCLTVEANNIRKQRQTLLRYIEFQYLRNAGSWQGLAVMIMWGGFALWNKPDPIYWLPPFLYVMFCLTGKVFGFYHWFGVVPFVVAATPNLFPLLLFLSFCQLAWAAFYIRDLYFDCYPGLYQNTAYAEMVGKKLRGKGTVWLNTWHHEIYFYLNQFPKYGIELPEGVSCFEDWKGKRNKLLVEESPKYIVVGLGYDGGVKVDSPRFVHAGPFTIFQLRGKTDL